MRFRLFAPLALALSFAALTHADDPKRPLDQSVYELWSAIRGDAISPDGKWALYSLTHEIGDGSIHIRSVAGDTDYAFDRGVEGAFSRDNAHAVFRIKPTLAKVRQAKREKKKKDDLPKDSMGIVDLGAGDLTTIDRVKSFALPEKAGHHVAALLEKPVKAKPKDDDEKTTKSEEPAEESTPPKEKSPSEPDAEKNSDAKKKKTGSPLLLIDLATGDQNTFEHVTEYLFDKQANFLAYVVSTKGGESDGVFVVDLTTGEVTDVMTGEGEYKSLAFDKAGQQLAFLSDRDDYQADEPEWTLHLWTAGEDTSSTVAAAGDPGVPDGWWVSKNRAPNFSESGDRLYFGAAPRPAPKPDPKDPNTPLPDELPKLDVWHWNEPDLHTMQLNNLEQEKKRSYLAVVHLTDHNRIVQLADQRVRDVEVAGKGDANTALGVFDTPYRKMIQWDVQTLSDLVLIDPRTGERETILEKIKAQPARGGWLSPKGNYIQYWDYTAQAWFAYNLADRQLVNLSQRIPTAVYNEQHDTPSLAGPYGLAGWLDDDAGVLIYDRDDLWLVDPHDADHPRCVTEQVGRDQDLRFRLIDLDHEEDSIDPTTPLLLSAFNHHNKNAGFYRDRIRGDRHPQQLLMAARRFSTPKKADDAGTLLLTRQSFKEFPDLWATSRDFSDLRRLSAANPQQSDYLWGDVKLVDWTSARGEPLQGMLYTPPNFDPTKKYPMMVYFYERNSDNLHSYSPPTPHRSIIRFSFYASRGYLIFVPDITYEDGHPGRSAVDCVLPGVASLIDQGFVDRKRIGVQGHSWGGYQSAYLITQTNIFAAAGSGAPVSNMTSAYGGIRWGSGMSRQFQYERTQSRIGGTLWEKPLLYLENSPLFQIESVTTPLLILHNDGDTAVPWHQGIELFMAMRRLGKPAWFLNYNGQPHWPLTYPDRRDYAIRMQQFFDHYLKDAPAPNWMTEGVPAIKKGVEFGLETPDK